MKMRALCLYFAVLLGSLSCQGCLDENPTGQIYTCHGTFTCYGDHFGLTVATGCAESEEEALALYLHGVRQLIQEAKCGDDYALDAACHSAGEVCFYNK